MGSWGGRMSSGWIRWMPQEPPKESLKRSPPKQVNSLWFTYVVSVAAACNAEFVTYPLDMVKTRLQIQGEVNAKETKLTLAPPRGTLKTAIGVVQEEGLLKLWQGMSAIVCRHTIYSGSRVVFYKKFRKLIEEHYNMKELNLLQSSFCGVTAGCLAQYIASPTDLLKVQMQMEGKRKLQGLPPRFNGLLDACASVYRIGGIPGLWKGAMPCVYRAGLVNLGDLTSYDLSKKWFIRNDYLKDGPILHTVSSTLAGFMAAVFGTPADVIKSRIMNQPIDENGRGLLYRSTYDCLQNTVRNEGFSALYKGFFLIWLRMAPWATTFWLTYEQILLFSGADLF